eukprot:9532610-Lingulodinium_polyedra.AAC.1
MPPRLQRWRPPCRGARRQPVGSWAEGPRSCRLGQGGVRAGPPAAEDEGAWRVVASGSGRGPKGPLRWRPGRCVQDWRGSCDGHRNSSTWPSV